MSKVGVFEIFFGPAWPDQARLDLASFLGENQFDFYIYAPKSDSHLRKMWREPWPDSYLQKLKILSNTYKKNKVRFGVALSPFGYDPQADRKNLQDKLRLLKDIGIESLGLFFDDMIYDTNALKAQIQAAETAQAIVQSEILFCPSYYSDDPILDKVFGQRPSNYLEEIGKQIPDGMEILWTGPKVISPEISASHLESVSEILQRKPFICDNIFANDGPKQCKYLKLRPLAGRSSQAFSQTSGWAFNPMNQIHLSKIVVLSAKKILQDGVESEKAFQEALNTVAGTNVASIIDSLRNTILVSQLDQLDDASKKKLSGQFDKFPASPVIQDIQAWLHGEYNVGSECLTD